MEKDVIYEAVAELWHVGMGVNTLFQKVQERLGSGELSTLGVQVTKQKVKAAKLILPYRYKTFKSTCSTNNEMKERNHDIQKEEEKEEDCRTVLSEERIKFVKDKINERQNHRRSRRFKDADYIQRGLEKMGVILNDATKTWYYKSPNGMGRQDERSVNELTDSNKLKNNKNDGKITCEMCGQLFESRNLVFKHLRDPGSGCGNSIFVTGQSLPTAPSIQKKVEKKIRVSATANTISRPRARTGRTAQHANSSSSVWIGDLPLPWSRVGGKYKRFRALLRQYLPRDVPQPWVKIVVRKAYRKRSTQPDEKVEQDNDKREKDEYLGFAIVVFRCDEEADKVRETLDGVEIIPAEVFRSDEMNEEQLLQIPTFKLKVRPVENSDSSMTPVVKKGGKDPPLSEQLRPFTVDELKKRILDLRINHDHEVEVKLNGAVENGETTYHINNNNSVENNKRLTEDGRNLSQSQLHDQVLGEAVALYHSIGPRHEMQFEGRPVPEDITKPLLDILQSLRWQVPNERRHLTAERYLVLPTNVSNDRFYGDLRQACMTLMQWADESYFYSGIAVTKNFVSSPHIDDRDQSYQYAISLGDFQGGELCVEGRKYNEENDSYEDYVNVINTRNRIARVDGRHIHWVRSWEGGDRYSLIFYDTTDRFHTPILETGICTSYLSTM